MKKAMLILILTSFFFIAGCYIDRKDIKIAEAFCKSHDGIDKIVNSFQNHQIICYDGSEITVKKAKKHLDWKYPDWNVITKQSTPNKKESNDKPQRPPHTCPEC